MEEDTVDLCDSCATELKRPDLKQCVDCHYQACQACLGDEDTTKGYCECKYSNFGDAFCDSQERNPTTKYKGPWKPYLQIEMENYLSMCEWREFKSCCARDCNKLLESVNFMDRKFCRCGCVIYCSIKCQETALTDKQYRILPSIYRQNDETKQTVSHADLCQPYMPSRTWPAVGAKLKGYKLKFGKYPGPFFPPPSLPMPQKDRETGEGRSG